MTRPDWKAAGAAGLLAGLTIGGFAIVAGSPLDRAVAAIELREGAVPSAPTGILGADPGVDPGVAPTPVPPAGDDPLTASVASPEVVTAPILTEGTTPRPPVVVDLDTDDGGSITSVDSADATD